MSGFYLRGALISYEEEFLIPAPNVIVFQFNPESMTHTWELAREQDASTNADGLAVRGEPRESFSFTLAMDASDMVADGSPPAAAAASLSGVYTRLASLEMLQFPVTQRGGSSGLMRSGAAAATSAVGGGGEKRKVPESRLPIVLFVWGPGRIVPVNLSSLAITETLYDAALNPTHAEASVSLRVLNRQDLEPLSGGLREVALAASKYSQGLRQTLAVANLGNSVDSIIGMVASL